MTAHLPDNQYLVQASLLALGLSPLLTLLARSHCLQDGQVRAFHPNPENPKSSRVPCQQAKRPPKGSIVSSQVMMPHQRMAVRPRLLRWTVLAFCVLDSVAASQKPMAEDDGPFTPEFAQFALQTLDDWKVPGLAIAVIDNDKVWSQV